MNAKSEGATNASNQNMYRIDEWGNGYFGADAGGCVRVQPDGPDGPSARLTDIVTALEEHGLGDPILLRFPQILAHRRKHIQDCFDDAVKLYDYPRRFQGVFPVKVNHDRTVVETLARSGRDDKFGLEVGSKAELCLALTIDLHPEALIICNGFKDRDYLELAVHAARHGRRVLVIAENPEEIRQIVGTVKEVGQRVMIGLRARLHSSGIGRWQESSGAKGKFGLSTIEIVEAVETLEREGLTEDLRALHFHIGSQVSDILNLKEAIREGCRLFAAVAAKLPALDILDIGGGLGVDYDGSRTATDWSVNYTVAEYARDAVYMVKTVCEEVGVAPPTVVTESGRALTAYHACIVLSSLRVVGGHETRDYSRYDVGSTQIVDLKDTLQRLDAKNYREAYHDAEQLLNELIVGFKMGIVSLEDRAVGECLYNDICHGVRTLMREHHFGRQDIKELEKRLAPKYVCNFSVFMSAPDTWAVDQLFPVCPIERLNEGDRQAATIGDITCDSDGKLERFIGRGETEPFLWLHEIEEKEPYRIAMFLMGAYQDVLGDFHNLFGTVNEGVIHVSAEGDFSIHHVEEGSSVEHSLDHFGFPPSDMVRAFDRHIDRRQSREAIQDYKGAFLRVLHGNTYMQRV